MTAPTVLLALIGRGAVLWVADGRLRYRAPVGALDASLIASAGRSKGALIALIRAGAVLPADLAVWPEDWRELYEERAAIMEFDGNLPRERAEQEAEWLARLEHARAWLDRAGMRPDP